MEVCVCVCVCALSIVFKGRSKRSLQTRGAHLNIDVSGFGSALASQPNMWH